MGEKLQWFGVASAGLFILIYIPLIIYFAYRFQLCKERTTVRRRFPSITLLMTMISCIWMGASPLQIGIQWFNYEFLDVAYETVYFVCHILFSFAFLWRFWLIHFQLNYLKQMSRTKWWVVIDPNVSRKTITNSWFMKQKNEKYGDLKFTLRIFIATCVICLLLFFGTIYGMGPNNFWGWLIRAFIYCIPWVIMIWLNCKETKLNDIHDSIFIRKEQKYVLNMYGLLFIIYILINVMIGVLPHVKSLNDKHLRVISNTFYGFFLHCFEFNLFAVCMLINWWPLHVNRIDASQPFERWNTPQTKQIFVKDESKYGRRLEFPEMCEDKV